MDKFLITGCSGFVGRHFLDYLEDNRIKCEILGIDLDPMVPHRNFRYVNMRSECVDLLDQNDIERIIFDFQPRYILHLASFSSVAFSWKTLLSALRTMSIFSLIFWRLFENTD